ncbi:hypothetical protein EPI10_022119 [Gossypium australe]|uniref:Gag-pro-like protein n=1 Tax=Gossypium australe TaxID=47621 RepID=A0A5B6WIP9_9ROSI|nr:hypothetical protein EPI10_022119 [Gossypium australe]
MMSQLTQLLAGGLENGKSAMINTGDDNEDPAYPPDFTSTNTQAQPQRVSINIKPQYQTGTFALINFPMDSGSNPGNNPANPVVPNLDDIVEMGKVRVELLKQLEDQYKWLEVKFKALKSADYHCGLDAKELSLVPDLVLPPKFNTPELEKYNGTSCPEAYIMMFCSRMIGYVNNDQLLFHCFQDILTGAAAEWYNLLSCAQMNSWKDLAPTKTRVQHKAKYGKLQFTPIPMTYRELYQSLFDAHVVSPFYLKPMQPLNPKWYDANAQCEYHVRITGHSIENCTVLKKLVKRLIKMGIVKFDDPSGTENLLPNYTDKGINAIVENARKKIKMNIAKVKTPLREVWNNMVERGLITQDSSDRSREAKNYCEFHDKEDHEIQKCSEFRALVEGLMDNKELEFFEYTEGEDVCASKEGPTEKVYKVNHPVVIISRPRSNEARVQIAPKVIIQKPVAFPYKDSKKVDRLVNNISANNFIFFNDDEIPPGGMGSTKALHITTRCKGYTLPGIHTAGAVPSSLHQKLKLRGLGKCLQGKVEAPMLKDKQDHFGLGFKPDARKKKKEMEKKQERRRARLSREEVKWEPMTFLYISKTFVSGGTIHLERKMPREENAEEILGNLNINAISEEGIGGENLSDICPYVPGSVLNNWTVEEIPIIFRANTKSPDINNMSDIATDSEFLFEQDMCTEDSRDFEYD